MFAIQKKDIAINNLITIIDTLIQDYISSITNCKGTLNTHISDDIINNSISMIESIKSILNHKLSNIICANKPINEEIIGKTLTCQRDSTAPSNEDIKYYKAIIDEIYDIHDKILNIQLIFVLIINTINDDQYELYIYSAVLYKILDNLLIIILKILKNIKIYDKDISKYRYTISVRRFLTHMENTTTNVNSYIITNNKASVDLNTEISKELKTLNMYSKKLPISFNETNKANIEKFQIDAKISEIKSLVERFAEIENIKDYSKLAKDTKIIDKNYNKDYNKEYEEVLNSDLNIGDNLSDADKFLSADEYLKMLKISLTPSSYA
jgi:hypothetical protein